MNRLSAPKIKREGRSTPRMWDRIGGYIGIKICNMPVFSFLIENSGFA